MVSPRSHRMYSIFISLCNPTFPFHLQRKEEGQNIGFFLYAPFGSGLRQSSVVPVTNSWFSDGSSIMSGRDFITAVHIRYNCLYNKFRATRGRNADKRCSRGWHMPETLNHISQQCYMTYGLRIKRRDAICKYLGVITELFCPHWAKLHTESTFRVDEAKLQPNLIAYSSEQVLIIDVQFVNDQMFLETAHNTKINKYSCFSGQLNPLRPDGVRFPSLTFNWRGSALQSSLSWETTSKLLQLGHSNGPSGYEKLIRTWRNKGWWTVLPIIRFPEPLYVCVMWVSVARPACQSHGCIFRCMSATLLCTYE